MRIIAFIAALLLAGCVSEGRSLKPGVHDAAAVRAEMGEPREVLKTPQGGEVWFYPRGIPGRATYRVELDSQGKVFDVSQALNEWNFDRVVAGKTTREELRRLLGPPNGEWTAMNGKETVWEYRYWWASQRWIAYFGIDPNGIVTGQHRVSEDGANERR